MGDGQSISLAAKAPHPNAGNAFIDYFLGEETLKIMAQIGEFVTRKGIYPPVPEADKIQLVDHDRNGQNRLCRKNGGVQKDIFAELMIGVQAVPTVQIVPSRSDPASEGFVVDGEWDVILIGAGQNNFALGTYLGMAGLRTVICESRLENGGRLASEEITLPGYWHNTLAYFQDNREVSPVWNELDWENGHHAEFVSPPVVSSLLLADGQSVSQHQALNTRLNPSQSFRAKMPRPGARYTIVFTT